MDIYEAHLRLFDATADEEPADRVRVAASQLELLAGAADEWKALLELAAVDLERAGMTQAEIGVLLGRTRAMAQIRVTSGKREAKAHARLVAAARRSARAMRIGN